MTQTADILIIGAGPYGLSCAWWTALREPKAKIVVVDEGDFACGGIGRNASSMRMQWGLELNIKLCKESIAFFEEAGKRLDYPRGIDLRQQGYLLLAHDESTFAQFKANHELHKKNDVPSKLLTPEECGKLVPVLNTEGLVGGSFCHKDGNASPFLWLDALLQAARRLNVEVRMNTRVDRLITQGDRFLVVTREQQDISAAKILLCTDWAAPQLLQTVGIDLPITGMPKQGLVTEAWPEIVAPVVISFKHDFAVSQVLRGNILAVVAQDRPDGDDTRSTPDYLSFASRQILDCLPGLAAIKVLRTWGGVISKTPDMQAILGETELENLYIAVSAYKGFMTSPAVGRIMSEALFDSGAHPEAAPFGTERFKTGNLIPEPLTV
ncbi:MAG: FAD-binding oxidoreductase [Arenicellales bacterium]|nr:FAD-binding oxidoreductase [Arenicellales bacterium]